MHRRIAWVYQGVLHFRAGSRATATCAIPDQPEELSGRVGTCEALIDGLNSIGWFERSTPIVPMNATHWVHDWTGWNGQRAEMPGLRVQECQGFGRSQPSVVEGPFTFERDDDGRVSIRSSGPQRLNTRARLCEFGNTNPDTAEPIDTGWTPPQQ